MNIEKSTIFFDVSAWPFVENFLYDNKVTIYYDKSELSYKRHVNISL